MSDYLSNLAAKSLNRTDVVQPRLALPFERLHPTDGSVSGRTLDVEPLSEERASGDTAIGAPPVSYPAVDRTVAPRVSAGGSRPEPDTSHQGTHGLPTTPGQRLDATRLAVPTPTETHQEEIGHRPPPSPPAPSTALAAPPQVPAPVLQPSAAQAPTAKESAQPNPERLASARALTREQGRDAPLQRTAGEQPPPVVEPSIQPVIVEQMAMPEQPRPLTSAADIPSRTTEGQRRPTIEPAIQRTLIERTVSPAEPVATSASSGETETVPSRHKSDWERGTAPEPRVPRSELPPAETAPAITQAPIVAEPHVTHYVEPATRPRAELAAAPGAAPTIRVTIGRVEVRATPPPMPTPKVQRPKAPVMSLDDYLCERAEGGSG
jgi:hypothetical protein